MQKLSEREIQVLKLVAAGRTSRAIAAELKISRRTVETHRAKMKMRTSLSTAELIRYAVREGIVEAMPEVVKDRGTAEEYVELLCIEPKTKSENVQETQE